MVQLVDTGASSSLPTAIGERLARVLDHLGVRQAHFLLRAPADLEALRREAPERIASVVVSGLSGSWAELKPLLDRTLWVQGSEGTGARSMTRLVAENPTASIVWLDGYRELTWSDTPADRAEELASATLAFLARRDAEAGVQSVTLAQEGVVDGVSYRAAGRGTPVVLLPLGLSAQQWDPLLPRLQAEHCTIVLGGEYLAPVSTLEARAAGSYGTMVLGVLDQAAPQADEALIEIGCGTGALLRRILERYHLPRVSGLDLNGYLLREARGLAATQGIADRLDLHEGSAESMPLPDAAFDVVFSSTMAEEGDAERMFAEMVRIARPGGRVVVIVRSVDLARWTNLALPAAVAEKALAPAGGVAEGGCADASLMRRLAAAGLQQVRGGPAWDWLQPGSLTWANAERTILSNLTDAEAAAWTTAMVAARAAGEPVTLSQPYHCALGIKPA